MIIEKPLPTLVEIMRRNRADMEAIVETSRRSELTADEREWIAVLIEEDVPLSERQARRLSAIRSGLGLAPLMKALRG